MAAKLTDEVRQKMFLLWQERQSLRLVSETLHVARTTVNRYRELDNWDARVAKIHAATDKKLDSAAMKRRVRWARQGKLLQAKGRKAFTKDKIKAKTATEAKELIKDGIEIERQALGENGEKDQIVNINIVQVKVGE